jgi:hypothetical protein
MGQTSGSMALALLSSFSDRNQLVRLTVQKTQKA